jgi:predicted glutamine amidotransferase
MMSAVPGAPAWGVTESERSLLRQSQASRKNRQADGWGLGWYRGAHAQWIKSPRPVFDEEDRLTRLAASSATRVAIAHIRKASNPMGLPRKKLLSTENAQPFAFKRYLFAHNGTLHLPRETAATLGAWESCVRGVNDSEVLFWLLVNYLEEEQSFRAALRSAAQHLWRVWGRQANPPPEPFSGLNILFYDGESLYAACCLARTPKRAMPSLCTAGWPFWQMCWRQEKDRVWMASEPLDGQKGWQALKPGRYLRADVVNSRVRVREGRLADCLQPRK